MVGTYGFRGSAVIQSLHLLHGKEGSSLLGFVLSDDVVDSKSVVGIKPGDSGMMKGIYLCLVSGAFCCSVIYLAMFHR